MTGDDRAAELARRYGEVRRRIESACAAAGRAPEEVTLVVVTKFFPAADALRLAALGVTDVGENRDQEARAKYAEVAAAGTRLRLHFVGQVQSNKARSVARYADVVHTVDRPRLVGALDRAAAAVGRRLDALVQVSLDDPLVPSAQRPELNRGGVSPGAARDLAGLVAACEHLRLRGVMAVAPPAEDPDEAFARLAGVASEVRADVPGATWISAGMSGDLEAAIRHGATHVRVGTAILGTRSPLR